VADWEGMTSNDWTDVFTAVPDFYEWEVDRHDETEAEVQLATPAPLRHGTTRLRDRGPCAGGRLGGDDLERLDGRLHGGT